MKKTWRYPLPVHRFRGILRSLFTRLYVDIGAGPAEIGLSCFGVPEDPLFQFNYVVCILFWFFGEAYKIK